MAQGAAAPTQQSDSLVVKSRRSTLHPTSAAALMVSSNRRVTRGVARVLRSAGVQVLQADPQSDLLSQLERSAPQFVFYDLEDPPHPASEQQCIFDACSDPASNRTLILLGRTDDASRLTEIFEQQNSKHVVGIANDVELPTTHLMVTVRKLLDLDIFGIEKYLRWGSVLHETNVTGRDDAHEGLSKLRGFLHDLHCRTRLIGEATTVAEEFIMNGLFDAPFDPDSQTRPHAQRHRADPVRLLPQQALSFTFGSDGEQLAIGCRDLFGSLDPNKMMRSLARGVRKGEDQISFDSGGAGIGLYMAFNFAQHMIVNVDSGQATEFIAIMDLHGSPARRKARQRSLNMFVLNSD